MLDINISLSNLFSGCFGKRRKSNVIRDGNQALRKALNDTTNPKQKIQIILQKITNGKYDSSFVFQIKSTNEFTIICSYGKRNNEFITTHLCLNTPIFIDGTLKFILCIRSDLNCGGEIEIQDEHLDLLANVLRELN